MSSFVLDAEGVRVNPGRVRAIAWLVAGAFLALAEAAIVLAARAVEKLYAADPYWLVAAYSEPWRTVAIGAVVSLSLAAPMTAALARRPPSWSRVLATVAAMSAGLAVCLELTTAVHFNEALGEVYVHTLVFRRAKVSLDKGDGGWCLRADFSHPFAWRLNGTSIHPRLLPLPYESSAVVRRLVNSSRGCAP